MRFDRLIVPVAFALALTAGAVPARAEIIDRVMAVVAGELITLSDVRAAIEFRMVAVAKSADPLGDALDRLIERQLMLVEVERYLPAKPPDQVVTERVDQIRGRYKTPEALAAALASTGLTVERLTDPVRDNVRIERYLEQRFAATAQPDDEELADYYREHAGEFAKGGDPPPLDRVREIVRQRLSVERRAALVAQWLEGLRRRAQVQRLYLPEARIFPG